MPFFLLAFVGCATAPATNPQAPEIRIEQLPASAFDVQQQGATSIGYRMTVRNHEGMPITLTKLEMRTVGRSPYVLRNVPVALNERVEAGQEKDVAFSMWAYPQQGQTKADTVWVEGKLSYEDAKGASSAPFAVSFRQPAATQ